MRQIFEALWTNSSVFQTLVIGILIGALARVTPATFRFGWRRRNPDVRLQRTHMDVGGVKLL
jgi:hypothetical protein